MTYDLIIVGADSAGLMAAVYAARKKLNTVILTKKLGGQMVLSANVENFPGFLKITGPELFLKIKAQVDNLGVEIKESSEIIGIAASPGAGEPRSENSGREKKGENFLLKTAKNGDWEARSVIIATGRFWRPLNVPGEREFVGKGVGVCATCDAPFFKGKDVAVVGGGNSAFDSAYDLLPYANKIYVVHHSEKFKGDEQIAEKLKNSGKVEFITNAETREIKGDSFVESLTYQDTKTGEIKEVKVGGVFINIGQIPNTNFVKGFLELNKMGEIVIDKYTNETTVPGVFAAGDVTDIRFKQAIIAASEGAKAALSAYEYLKSLNRN